MQDNELKKFCIIDFDPVTIFEEKDDTTKIIEEVNQKLNQKFDEDGFVSGKEAMKELYSALGILPDDFEPYDLLELTNGKIEVEIPEFIEFKDQDGINKIGSFKRIRILHLLKPNKYYTTKDV